MKKTASSKLFATFCFIIVHVSLLAQDAPGVQKALLLVQKNADAIGLSKEDITNARISNTYADALSGCTLVYLQQTQKGIDVDRVMQVLAFKNDKLVSAAGKRMDLGIQGRLSTKEKKTITPTVTIENAIRAAAKHLNLPAPSFSFKSVPNQDFSKAANFGNLGIAKSNVTARLLWVQEKSDGRILLAWEVNISPQKTSDSWRIIVDAQKGNIIFKYNKKRNYQ